MIIALLFTSTLCFSPNPNQAPSLALDLNSITMAVHEPNILRLDFKCKGGSGIYSYDFNGLASGWWAQGSSVYFPRSDLESS